MKYLILIPICILFYILIRPIVIISISFWHFPTIPLPRLGNYLKIVLSIDKQYAVFDNVYKLLIDPRPTYKFLRKSEAKKYMLYPTLN